MLSTNSTTLEATHVSGDTRMLHHIASIVFIVTGIPANLIPIAGIIRSKLYRQVANVFILNLAINNTIVCCLILPYISFSSFIVMGYDEGVDNSLCRFVGWLTYSMCGAETLGIVLVSLNRFIIVVYHEKYHMIFKRKFNVIAMLAFSWLIYPIWFIFPATEVWGKLLYDPQRFFCHPFVIIDSFSYSIIIFLIVTTIPVLAITYVAIVNKVWVTGRKVSIGRSISKDTKESKVKLKRRSEKQLVMTVIIIITSFLSLYIPFLIMSVIDPGMEKYSPIAHVATLYVAWAHCIIDPIIYTLMNTQIKTASILFLTCGKSQRELRLEQTAVEQVNKLNIEVQQLQ